MNFQFNHFQQKLNSCTTRLNIYIYINCKKMYEEEREKNLTLKVKVFDFVGEYNKKKRYETM